jgi:DNA repair protein RadC
VASYVRSDVLSDGDVVLRAVLVDEESRHLVTRIVARGESELAEFDPSAILDEAFIAGAAGIIFVRGTRSGSDERLSIREVERASAMWRSAERIGIHVLDYILVTQGRPLGLFAISKADRPTW